MKKLISILLLIIFLSSSLGQASADSPYTTWALGPDGWLVKTQDAYRPYDEVDLDISGAEDMFITKDGVIYIADTGNGRIVTVVNNEITAYYGKDILQAPTGIFVDDEGTMYIADGKSNTIVILDAQGNLIGQFGRPSEPLFGKDKQFLPRKVVVDKRKNIYVISEGSTNGVVQMNTNGNFIGYFGANTASMSLKMILQRIFLTKEQLDQFIKNEAASPSNIAIDKQSMIYTITSGTSRYESIRKFTIAGKNIFQNTFGSTTFRDLNVSDNGLVLGVDSKGQIYEYDLNGTLLFVFGAQDKGEQRLGTLSNPTAIDRYQEFIYVLDKEKNALVIYETTAFAQKVHEGVRLYMNGFYDEAKPYFEEVLKFNGLFIMAYQGIADAYFKDGNYQASMAAYRFAEDRNGYSQSFWELRNADLQRNLSSAILWILGLWIGLLIFTRVERKRHWLDPVREWFHNLTRIKLVDDFVFMFRFIKQPVDSFYYIKKKQRGSLLFAILIYLWVIAARIVSIYATGFVFSEYTSLTYFRIEDEVVKLLVIIGLWNAANYLVSTISDGEGRVRDVVIGTAYSLFPYVLFALPIAFLSNVLTINEQFLYDFSIQLMWAWTAMMLFIMVKEIHNYSFSETVRNILMTIFTMLLFLLAAYILNVLINQLIDFVSAIVQEVGLRG